jgi:hypothetical protein
MALTLTQVFGPSATLTAGILSVDVTELYQLDSTTPSPTQILAALILGIKAIQPSSATEDVSLGIVVGDPFSTISRNDTQLERQFPVGIYTPISISALDPDNVV